MVLIADTLLCKLTSEDDESASRLSPTLPTVVEVTSSETTSTIIAPTRSSPTTEKGPENSTEAPTATTTETSSKVVDSAPKPKPRLLNLNVDELQNFANILHNQTKGIKNSFADLSDVNLDEDEDESPRIKANEPKNTHISDSFYTNLKGPLNPLLVAVDRSEETETCKENGITYKIGEHLDRGCEETCECTSSGTFECAPRCQHPYIRRGRRISDPLCFESPVDECCSLIACATGSRASTLEVCRYGNGTYSVGDKWNIGCEQTCTCEQNSVITCKPRCKRLPQSDKCINVQDPHDECCEMQICDVSQDVHEESVENITSSTSSTTDMPRDLQDLINLPNSSMRPLVLTEPIGSIKVLQNNSVQVNLMQMNKSEDPIHLQLSSDGGRSYSDVELKYNNLILNLEGGKDYVLKTKETGTKFNFTITASDVGNEVPVGESLNVTKIGCYHDGKFYAVGDEFQIGCSELCECTGPDARECAPLLCPSHVGLELVSKGCVRWAPNPPPTPPNCCPRTARCLSDGTCHYKGVAIPNWSEVPLELTGCEEHCFCENGELDCEEACAPLPPIPPQNLRCPPMHRPAPVNISDEDCCKQWGCIPHAGNTNASVFQTYAMPTHVQTIMNYVTPVPVTILPVMPIATNSYLPIPTERTEFHNRLSLIKSNHPIFFKTLIPQTGHNNSSNYLIDKLPNHIVGDNITVFTPEDIDSPFKTIHPEPPLVTNNVDWTASHSKSPVLSNHFKNLQLSTPASKPNIDSKHHKPFNIIKSDGKLHEVFHNFKHGVDDKINTLNSHGSFVKQINDNPSVKKVPLSQIDNLKYFLPTNNKEITKNSGFNHNDLHKSTQNYFEPKMQINKVITNFTPQDPQKIVFNQNDNLNHVIYNTPEKHTIMKTKDLKTAGTSDFKSSLWRENTEKHLLNKEPNPYETVLLRVPNAQTEIKSTFVPTTNDIPRDRTKTYSTLDLERLLNNMELETEVNRNLGRSADKSRGTITLGQLSPGFPAKTPQAPPQFLPTVPPDDHYPPDDVVDDEQNNIHHPNNPLEPPINGLPSGLPIPGYGDVNKKLSVLSLQSDSPTSIKMLFGLPPVLVGLRGSVDLRYTDSPDEDVSQWYSQVFAPADEILTTPRLEFRLTGLKPSTTYKIRGKLYLHNLPVEPESEINTVTTQDLPTVLPPEEKRREIDCKLTVVDVNDTTAHVSWRHFTEDELQFIDGIQVRYRPTGTPIYSMTELLHHSRSNAELRELRPGSRYEASLVLIPPPRTTTELHDPSQVEFTTAPYIDPYNWSVTLEARAVGAEALQLTWRGVPPPAERWVRVVRAAHSCGPRDTEHDAFRLAARDSPPSLTITGLTPDSRCRVWLELFLTNGKVKTSNVLEIHTKSLDSSEPIDNVIEASSVAGSRAPRGDYYGALVVVGVIAALGALTSVLLLLVVIRRHRPRSVAITSVPSAPRESSLPPYDNPAYKLELQQETMGKYIIHL
ncbi:unnamed protein product [Euphydryas editha]|uniref:Epidermal cell surface receptor n=1 Tax=Euphydryas editha TaxID=104508 RepID=A0AAU9U698_EUPED|nr:unnamed protein product [Euphydryas editha]